MVARKVLGEDGDEGERDVAERKVEGESEDRRGEVLDVSKGKVNVERENVEVTEVLGGEKEGLGGAETTDEMDTGESTMEGDSGEKEVGIKQVVAC